MEGFSPKNFQEGLVEAAGRNIEEGMKYFDEMVELTWTITEAKVSTNGVDNPDNGFTLERREGDKIAIGVNRNYKVARPKLYVQTGNLELNVRIKKENYQKEDWLVIKKSTVPNAGLGVFAKRPFKKDEVIGMYGGKKGDTRDSIYALQNHEDRFVPIPTKLYMGMHFLNSSWKNEDKWPSNVEVENDLIARAIEDIAVGNELFWNYKYGPPRDDETSDEDKDDQGDKKLPPQEFDENEDVDSNDDEYEKDEEWDGET